MHEAWPLIAAKAQSIEQAVDMACRVAAALYREARRLVEHDRVVVAMDDVIAQRRIVLRPGAGRWRWKSTICRWPGSVPW